MRTRWSPKPATISWRIKPVVHLLSLLPFFWLLYGLFTNNLGVNPVEVLTDESGTWALRFLLLSLAMTPLRQMFGLNWLALFRRMIGLYAFFYALVHFCVYFLLDQSLNLAWVWEDVLERPYITVGFAALCILLALSSTSTNGIRRRMRKNWNRLHKTVYLAGILILLHFLWLTRADYREPAVYVGIFAFLMSFRLYEIYKKRN